MKSAHKAVGKTKSGILMLPLVLITFAAIGAAYYFWNDAREAKNNSPEAVAQRNQEESDKVLAALSTVMSVPEDGTPTVAKIDDAETLRNGNPDFYGDAENGDYLILFPKRAIIFRLDNKKIVNFAPILGASPGQSVDDVPADEDADSTTNSDAQDANDTTNTEQ